MTARHSAPMIELRPLSTALLCLLMAPLSAADGGASAERELDSQILRYLDHGGVVVTRGAEVLYQHRGDDLFIPASTLKIATALAALRHLGTGHRYKTEFYLHEGYGDLTIRGYGDPFLVSEEWQTVVDELVKTGQLPEKIRRLYLDTSTFSPAIRIPGISSSLNPYDAANGALAANFNTIYVSVGGDGSVRSAEEQTPLTPLARELAAKLSPGKHRINISREPGLPTRYVGELVGELLKAKGHEIVGSIEVREKTPADQLIYTHLNNRSLEELIAAMMLYSNNFIANQLTLILGLESEGVPATLEKGVRFLNRFLVDEVGLDVAEFDVAEGSGISRQNRFTPLALAEVVGRFHPYRHLLTERDGVWLKTGTLNGVYTLAGFLPSDGEPLSFVILLNQPRNTRDQILSVLIRAFD